MLKPGERLICLLLLAAGCSTGVRQAQNPVPRDWHAVPPEKSGSPGIEKVTESPRAAAPPGAEPERPGLPGNPPLSPWISLEHWSHEHGLGPLRQLAPAPAPAFALTTSRGVLVVHINSLVADWQGVEFHLGFDPRLINGSPFVHVLDMKKNIEPLLLNPVPSGKTNLIIVLDPGHGGTNTGTISVAGDVYEKDYTLDWARRLEPLLAGNGWHVFLTRTNDMDLTLSNRVAIAEEHKADLFISLHFNSAAPDEDQAGLETYCLTPAGMPSTLTRGYDDDVSQVLPNNAFDAENVQYAFRVQQTLLPVIGGDRGVRRARFLGVLRGQHRPSILIEGGYLSNPQEAHRIADPAYRQELAEAVAQALTTRTDAPHPPKMAGGQNPQNPPPGGIPHPAVASGLHPATAAATNSSSP